MVAGHAVFQLPARHPPGDLHNQQHGSLNRSRRRTIRTLGPRGGFGNEESPFKWEFLALRRAAKKWTMPIQHWREALNHFTILWPERMPALERVAQ